MALALVQGGDFFKHGCIITRVELENWWCLSVGRGEHSHSRDATRLLGPSFAFFVASGNGLPLMNIKVCEILGGHNGLGLIWVTKVPVPGAINDSKDIVLHSISRRCLSRCTTSLGGPAGGTTTTTLTATLPLVNTRDLMGRLKARVIVNAAQEVGRCLGEIDLYDTIIVDDSEEHIKFTPLDSAQEETHLGLCTQAMVGLVSLLQVGSFGLEACMFCNIPWECLLCVLVRP